MSRSADEQVVTSMLNRVPVSDQAKKELLTLMGAADRHYHNISHLAVLWRRHRGLCSGTGMDEPEVELRLIAAILWHDAIYVAGRRDNEQRSAELWSAVARGSNLSTPVADWVVKAILATGEHAARRSPNAAGEDQALKWLLDLDLTPLGEPPEEFARNTARLAREFEAASDSRWRHRRIGFLRCMADCPHIYLSPSIAAAYEAQARANIARELATVERD